MKYFEKKSLTMKVSLIVFIVCAMILSVECHRRHMRKMQM